MDKIRLVSSALILLCVLAFTPPFASAKGNIVTYVDIGNPSSEGQVVMSSWGPIEPTAHPGTWGGLTGTARVVYAPSIGDGDMSAYMTFKTPTWTKPFQICVIQIIANGVTQLGYSYPSYFGKCLDKMSGPYSDFLGRTIYLHQFLQTRGYYTPVSLTLLVLDGQATDSFRVFVNNIQVYSYVHNAKKTCLPLATCEQWITHTITLPSLTSSSTFQVQIQLTGSPWSQVNTYGQLAVDSVEVNWAA
jgi:hypothetical protein